MRNVRWYIAGLLLLATTLSYLDRQTLSIIAPFIRKEYGMSNSDYAKIVQAFLLAYGLMQPFVGRFIDWVNTRRGFVVSVVGWSLAGIAHAFGGSVLSFSIFRFALGATEAGSFPASVKTVAEWFPEKERTIATGIFNMGAGLGAVVAPPIVVFITHHFGWRVAFIATGLAGFIWVLAWLLLYHPLDKHPMVTAQEREYIRSGQDTVEDDAPKSHCEILDILRGRNIWALMIARSLTDPVWYFYVFWLPDYLKNARHFSLTQIGLFAWVPFLAADIGSMAGGALSAFFVKRGCSVINARKAAMCISAILMPVALFAVRAHSAALAVFLISVATFGHQSWAASMLTLPADLFPKRIVASAYGIPGACGNFAGMGFAALIGWLLDRAGYAPVFTIAGCLHPIAALIILAVIRSPKKAVNIGANGG